MDCNRYASDADDCELFHDRDYKKVTSFTLSPKHPRTSSPAQRVSYESLSVEDGLDEEPESLEDVLKEIESDISVEDFIKRMALVTRDGGATFKQVLQDELSIFNTFVRNVFDNQNLDISHLLLQEESSLRDRYEQWTRMIQNRSRRVKNFLSDLMPNFSWEEYKRKYGSQSSVPSSIMSSELGADGDFSTWRQESFLKLLFLEDEAKKLQSENDEMMKNVEELRCKKYLNHTRQAKAGKVLHQNNIALEKKLKHLREERNRLSNIINELFRKYEATQHCEA